MQYALPPRNALLAGGRAYERLREFATRRMGLQALRSVCQGALIVAEYHAFAQKACGAAAGNLSCGSECG